MAVATLQRAVSLSYEPERILPSLALAEEAFGRREKACEAWSRVARAHPDAATREDAIRRATGLDCPPP
jgi:1,2-phenylacetyl-CoA epoxidase PaaB subunit